MLACQGGPRTRATFSVRLNISSGDGGQNLECNEQRGKETGGETRVIPVRGLYAWGPIVRPLSRWIHFVRSMHAGLKQVRTSFKAKIQICGLPPPDEMCDYSEANLKITRFSVFDSRFSILGSPRAQGATLKRTGGSLLWDPRIKGRSPTGCLACLKIEALFAAMWVTGAGRRLGRRLDRARV